MCIRDSDWTSVFGGPAWTRVMEADGQPGQWYLHLFDSSQPDLNWANPEVVAEFEDILRFWFDRGADGFRIDVAHGLAKDADLPSLNLPETDSVILQNTHVENHPYWDRPEVQDIYEGWRRIADTYDPPRVFVAEAWVESADKLAQYLLPTRLHSAFDFEFIRSPWNAKSLRTFAQTSLTSHDRMDAPVMWVQSNHDVTRHVTRLGRDQTGLEGDVLHAVGPSDLELGRRRARAAIMMELALPGGVYLYQGEELGLEEVLDLPEEVLEDPTWERSGHTVRGRDGCRVPIPWTTSGPSLGFGPADGGAPWLPQPEHWAQLSVEAEDADRRSMLWLYRDALRLRRELPQLGSGGGELVWTGEEPDVLGFTRGQGFICMVNTGTAPIPLPPGDVVLSSVPIEGGQLPSDAAVWITIS